MLVSILTTGFVSLTAVIIGVRVYNVYYNWGDYKQMIQRYGGRKSLKNFTIIITGCNSGIGKQTAYELYKNGARIIMANRNRMQTEDIIKEFKKNNNINNDGELIYKHLDLCSIQSVNEFCNDIIKNEDNIHILINNAAIFGAPINKTDDNFEINMQVNHLSSALLTQLLLPKLQQSKIVNDNEFKPRIISVTSTLTKNGIISSDEHFSTIENNEFLENLKSIDGRNIYQTTKLANLHYMLSFSRKQSVLKNVEICFASPGFCYTRLHRYQSFRRLLWITLFTPLFLMIVKSSKQGAQTIIGCSMLSKINNNVLYHNCKKNENFLLNNNLNQSIIDHYYDVTMKSINKYLIQ